MLILLLSRGTSARIGLGKERSGYEASIPYFLRPWNM